MRYTRHLATAALIVAAGLGMSACSAHPGAAVVTSSGVTYSNAEVEQAIQQLVDMKFDEKGITGYSVRRALLNEGIVAQAIESLGMTVSDEQVDATTAAIMQQTGGTVPAEMGRATRALMRSLTVNQLLNMRLQADPTFESQLNAAVQHAQEASGMGVNPRFPQPTVGGGQEPTTPLFGDAVSGKKNPDPSALLGGGTSGNSTR